MELNCFLFASPICLGPGTPTGKFLGACAMGEEGGKDHQRRVGFDKADSE
jgi:hypothetical protein